MEVCKEYKYVKNGKVIRIKRKYEVKGVRSIKQSELEEYFKNNADDIRTNKKLVEVLADYNNTHENKISYSMLYTKYKSLFGCLKKHNSPVNSDESDGEAQKQESV